MNGEYPVIIDGENLGTLSVWKDGLMTVFEADCEDVERLVRLSVFGPDGSEGRLGVMIPENGRLHLRKCFSRSALEAMPGEIACAAETGKAPQPAAEPADEGEEPAQEAEQEAPESECAAEQEPEEEEKTADTIWFPVPEGTLVSLESPSMLAMPWREGVTMGVERLIEGKRYAIISPDEIAIPAE